MLTSRFPLVWKFSDRKGLFSQYSSRDDFPGDFYGEISVNIYGPNGDLAAEIGAGTDASEIILSLCP